jgi:hypothetical protein
MNQHTATAARVLANVLGDAVTKIGNTLIATARLVPSLTRWNRDQAMKSMVAKCAGVDARCARDRRARAHLRRDITDVGGSEPTAMTMHPEADDWTLVASNDDAMHVAPVAGPTSPAARTGNNPGSESGCRCGDGRGCTGCTGCVACVEACLNASAFLYHFIQINVV